MKKAVFIGSAGSVANVYSPEVMSALHDELTFETDHVIAKNELDSYFDTLSHADYIFSTWGMPHFTREEIKKYLPNVKALFYGAGSVQGFAREFLEEGVAVFSAWAANAVPVADYTFAEIMLASKGYFNRYHRASEGSEWQGRSRGGYPGIYEIKVGILGAGMIGKMVIERLKTLEKVDILVFDPFLPDEKAEQLGVRKCSLETIFEECDVISNHLANNSETVGIINKTHFSKMKPCSSFINTGRGAQVVEADMIEALKRDSSISAVLDVTFPEPPEKDSPLYTLDNVFLTPHIAGSLGNEVHRMGEYMLDELRAYDSGKPVKYSVSLEMLKTMA